VTADEIVITNSRATSGGPTGTARTTPGGPRRRRRQERARGKLREGG
jgi:hypothetical protein